MTVGTTEERSGYLHSGERALYGRIFLPPGGACDTAVVLFDPFGEEKKCAYRLLVRLARALAGRGVAVLRVDLSGTGDSPGDHREATLARWYADADAAVRAACAEAGATRWAAVGARFGALHAVHAAAAADAAAVVLVEPVLDGADYLRDLERRQRIKQMMSGAAAEEIPDAREHWGRGELVDFGGLAVSPTLAEELNGAELPALVAALPDTTDVAVLRVSGSRKLPPAWEPLVTRAEATPPGGAEVVRDKPFWGQLEYYESDLVIDAVAAWLAAFGLLGDTLDNSEAGDSA